MRSSRYRRPTRATTGIGEPIVRHDVLMVPENPRQPPRRLHGGVAIEAEARLLFAQAVRESREEPGPPFAVALERVTTETLAILEPGASEVTEAQPPAPALPALHPAMGPVGMMVAALARWLENTAAVVAAEAEALETRRRKVRAWAGNPLNGHAARHVAGSFVTVIESPAAPDGLVIVQTGKALATLFKLAAHHQGGHSPTGRMISEALDVPFPLTMPDLSERAMAIGLTPATLWPWRGVPGCTDADVAATPDKGEACRQCGRFAAFGHEQQCPEHDDAAPPCYACGQVDRHAHDCPVALAATMGA